MTFPILLEYFYTLDSASECGQSPEYMRELTKARQDALTSLVQAGIIDNS